MRIVCLCNNWLGLKVLQLLREQGQEIVCLIVHSAELGKYQDEIRATVDSAQCLVFDASQIEQLDILEQIRSSRPDIAVSVLFRKILRPSFLSLFPRGCINLHPAYLPYNRGSYPNVWSIVDKTPAGVTLHYIDAGVDTGDIIAQEEVELEPTDTGGTLYGKLERAALDLFRCTWPSIESGRTPRTGQGPREGTYHRQRDVENIDEIDLEKSYRGEDLINLLRARTFPPYRGAYFRFKGRKIYMRLELWEE